MELSKITGDPDKLEIPISFSARMWNQALTIGKRIEESLTNIVADNLEMYNYGLHRHNYHQHNSEKGHSYYDGCITSGNAGKTYLYNTRSYMTLIELLITEYQEAGDWDGNGMIFYHDFCFSYDDPDVPIGLKNMMASFTMPGFSKPHYSAIDGISEEDDSMIWEDEYNIIHIGFEDDGCTPKFIDRNKQVQVISWIDYLRSLPQEFFDQRAPLLKAEYRNVR